MPTGVGCCLSLQSEQLKKGSLKDSPVLSVQHQLGSNSMCLPGTLHHSLESWDNKEKKNASMVLCAKVLQPSPCLGPE